MVPERLEDGWEIGEAGGAGLDLAALRDMENRITADENKDFHSLLIARSGRLVVETYFNGYDRHRLHDIRSAGKSFTSTLIGIALDNGILPDIATPVLPYFERYRPFGNPDPRKERISVGDLLTMQSGFEADDQDMSSPGCEETMLRSDDWIRFILDLPMAETPGTHWVYAGVNTMLLAALLEEATGAPALDFAKEKLFAGLGIDSFHWVTSPNETIVGQGFLSLRARDQIKLGQLYLNGGVWNGKRVVSEKWTRDAIASHAAVSAERQATYGYQWWGMTLDFDDNRYRCFFATGNGGNKIYVVPDLELVVGIASSAYNKPYMHTRSYDVLRQVIEAIRQPA